MFYFYIIILIIFFFEKIPPLEFQVKTKKGKSFSHNVTWFLHLVKAEKGKPNPVSSTSNKAEGNERRRKKKRKNWMTLTYLDHLSIIRQIRQHKRFTAWKINKENVMVECDKTLHDMMTRRKLLWFFHPQNFILFIYLPSSFFILFLHDTRGDFYSSLWLLTCHVNYLKS